MDLASYSEILSESADLCGLDPEALSTEEYRALRRFHNKRLRTAWEEHFWPDLMLVEQRWFRAVWAVGTAYTAGTEVYHEGSDAYYQAVKASTGQAPEDGAGTINYAYWAECETEYDADEYSSSTAYVAGDLVSYGGKTYSCHTASTNHAPTNTSYWGEVVPFKRYVAWEQTGETETGTVAAVWDRDPEATTKATELVWSTNSSGVQVNSLVTFCWVEFRQRATELVGEVYSATETYTTGDQAYKDGEMKVALDGTPTWAAVEIPRIFQSYLALGAAADYQRGPGKDLAESDRLNALAEAELERQKSIWFGSSGQRLKTVVVTR